ncbi:hypothetical protein XBLMG947_2699 [Xanthomonas bromi]|uniref:Uncharacterized protein n=1 Tax=Xanthomonas bromi TaxID=56449 RepID=A0A1C3NNF0_9XANT|nr:hypothetical protein XbrCFBP1976_12120 [Xanthomonas bromi]SBV51909.1 hypothetical protein XBLMG947_2699 [Xanthomonas bromi]
MCVPSGETQPTVGCGIFAKVRGDRGSIGQDARRYRSRLSCRPLLQAALCDLHALYYGIRRCMLPGLASACRELPGEIATSIVQVICYKVTIECEGMIAALRLTTRSL